MPCGTLMIQGTSSDAGKSTLVASLCRLAARDGLRVAPFKPQNMSLNSVVACDGGEIGRAQAWQAFAAGIAPHTDMNPVLLKPNSETGAQVIIQGRARGDFDARSYQRCKSAMMQAVLDSFRRVRAAFDVVFVEGAGSPAEINLRCGDIANMGFAEAIDCPVVLVADIEHGGVFAQVVGTLACLSEAERERVKGIVINKFRGDRSLLTPGIDWLEARTSKCVFGIVPFVEDVWFDQEDGLPAQRYQAATHDDALNIVVPALPHISNHTDFDPLRAHPQVNFHFVRAGELPPADLIVLPGSKNVQRDLAWLREQGWETYLQRHLRYGGKLIGICGGMQMLGRELCDPHTIESRARVVRGLGLLDFTTTFKPEKRLFNVTGRLALGGAAVRGYEIHKGESQGAALNHWAVALDPNGIAYKDVNEETDKKMRFDGAISADNQILATYLHGLFDTPHACSALLKWAGLNVVECIDHDERRRTSLDKLADTVAASLDLDALWKVVA